MPNLIASQTAAANSADIVLTDGASATLNLMAGSDGIVPADAGAAIQIKDSNGVYVTFESLNRAAPVANILGPGTFRVAKGAAATAFGVDKW